MAIVFFKRYRMQYDLRDAEFASLNPPPGYRFQSWQDQLLSAHAEVKFRSFRNEMDANVFPCLGDADGCVRLMREISNRRGFLPETTWLATYHHQDSGKKENVGTIQGIRDNGDVGSIQNIGIIESHRGKGVGSLIVKHCLQGFQRAGVRFVTLEVTVKNSGAIRLYERLGFRILKSVLKSVEIGNYE